MKAYKGSGGIVPLDLNLVTRWRGVWTFTPRAHNSREERQLRLDWSVGWFPGLIWTFWRRLKPLVPAMVFLSLVSIPSTLSCPLIKVMNLHLKVLEITVICVALE